MKPVTLFVFALTLSMFAQDHHEPQDGGGRRGGGGFRGGPMRSAAMRILDVDHDGVISASEVQQAAARFAELDANHDNKLTEAELRPAGGRGPGGPGGPGGGGGNNPEEMVSMMLQFDKNGDGALQKSEVPERMQGIFERGDTNQDGVLTREELTAAASRQANRSQEGGGPGGPGGRGPDGMGMMMRMDPVMRALDTNQDGEISSAEWNAAPQALAKLDKNGDGQLTMDELRPEFPQGRQQQRERRGGNDH